MKNQFGFIKMLMIIFLSFFNSIVQAQFAVNYSTNYVQLMDSFKSSGVTISNISFTGNASACGYFTGGNTTNLGVNSGTVLSTGMVTEIGKGFAYNANTSFGTPGNSLLNTLSGANTLDAAVLEFDVLPANDTLSFSYIFGSEDYPEYVGGNPLYHDYLGAFVTGTNPSGGNYTNQNFALVPKTGLPVTINSINDTTNAQFFVKNTSGVIVFDGFTKLLQVKIPVVPAVTYHLTIAIADGGDQIFDSGIFLKNHSLKSYSNTSGLSEPIREAAFHFYPNPVTDKIIFNTSEKGTLIITNQLGQLISTEVITENQTQISTEHLHSGVYFITFQTEKNCTVKQLIVRK